MQHRQRHSQLRQQQMVKPSQRITRVASEVQDATEKDEKIRAIITGKEDDDEARKRERIRDREINKEIKKYIRENKRTKRQERIQKIL